MSSFPPFHLKRQAFYWLEYLIDQHQDGDALNLLWWQVSIGPEGINQHLARKPH